MRASHEQRDLVKPVDVRHTALLVIDMQNGWCHPDGAMVRAGQNMSNQQAIVPNVRRLVQACRELGMPVMWSIQEHLAEDVTQERRRIASHLRKRNILPAPWGTWDAELVAPLKEVSRTEDFLLSSIACPCSTRRPWRRYCGCAISLTLL